VRRNLHKVWIVFVLGILVLVTACGPKPTEAPTAEPAEPAEQAEPEAFDWRRYEGETIRILLWNHPAVDYWEEHLQEFKDLTGIDVVWDKVDVWEVYPKTLLELTAAPEEVDVYSLVPPQQGYKFSQEGFMEDLEPFATDPSLTAPDYNYDDFLPGVLGSLNIKGIQGGIPMYVHHEMLIYRCDLYEEAGLEPAETFEELRDNAAKLHDPDNEIYGAVYRGIGPQAVWPLSAWMWGYGGDWMDSEGNPTINSPETVAAIEMYGEILGKYGPPGPTDLDDGRMQTLFKQGQAAHYLGWSGFALSLVDPEESKVVGNVCYAKYPSGPTGHVPISMGVGLSMSYKSQHKEAAWYFIQWATSPEMQQKLQVETGVMQGRRSVWESEEIATEIDEKSPGWRELAIETMILGRGDCLPPAEDVAAARDIIGVAVTTAIQGGDVQGAADTANEKYAKLLEGVPIEELIPPTATPEG
jgi:multiple sugar transport system substrate-binding protein